MNILLLHPHDIASPQEPWTIRIVSLAREFVKKGYKVKLVYFRRQDSTQDLDKSIEDIEAVALERRLHPSVFLHNMAAIWRLARWADVVHVQKCFPWAAIPAFVAAYLTGKPLHYDWDDWEEKIWLHSNRKTLVSSFLGWYLKILEICLPLLADTVSVSSDALFARCLEIGVARKRIIKVPVGADIEAFSKGYAGAQAVRDEYGIKAPIVLYIGQLHSGQYADLFIEAAGGVMQHMKDIVFIIAGDGWRLAPLRQMALDLGLNRHFIFTGSLPHDAVASYVAAADICVACFEDNEITRCKSPLKIAEYLAAGKAIVASRVGEVRNMVGGVGLLVEPGSSRALSDGIVKLFKDAQLKKDLEYASKKRARARYDWAISADVLLGVYESYFCNKRRV